MVILRNLKYLVCTDIRAEWNVLYLLEGYGQSVKEKSGSLARLIRFFGWNGEEIDEMVGEGEGIYGSYWYM